MSPLTIGLDGDLHLEVEVQTELQSFLGCDGTLVGASDELSASDGRGSSRREFGSGFGADMLVLWILAEWAILLWFMRGCR